MLKCGFCHKEFNEDHPFQAHDYLNHVQACKIASKVKRESKERGLKIKQISKELEELKGLKIKYEEKKAAFKCNYPDVYDDFFSKEDTSYEHQYDASQQPEDLYVISDSLKNALMKMLFEDFRIIQKFK